MSRYLEERRQRECFGIKPAEEKKEVKQIAKKSDKMKKEDKQYRKFIAEYLSHPDNKYCRIKINNNCTKIATTVNHKRRRGVNKMNEAEIEPSCSYCNIEIEAQDNWARDNGHLKSKY